MFACTPFDPMTADIKITKRSRSPPKKADPMPNIDLLADLPITHSGLLRRRRLLLGWSKPRLFVVKSGYLLCHPGAAEGSQSTVVDLDRCTVITLAARRNKFSRKRGSTYPFTLCTASGKVVMRLMADSATERGAWVQVLTSVRRRKLADFRTVAKLGSGAYGSVTLVRETTRSVEGVPAPLSSPAGAGEGVGAGATTPTESPKGQFYALKQVYLSSSGDQSATSIKRAAAERAVLQLAGDHPFVTKLHYAFVEDDRLHYVQALGTGGDLFDNLRAQPGKKFTEAAAKFLGAELLLAIGHLHGLGVIHRDIKLENVLLDSAGHVMLADFGLAKNMQGLERSHSFVGTERYCPPEMWMNIGHGRGADFWQFGCLMFELLTGRPPFYSRDSDRQRKQILAAKLRFPEHLSADAKSLLTGLLKRNTWERLGSGDSDIADVKSHPFFADVDWDLLLRREIAPPYCPATSMGDLSKKDEAAKATQSAVPKVSSAPSSLKVPDQLIGFDYCGEEHLLGGLLDSDDEDSTFTPGQVVSSVPLPKLATFHSSGGRLETVRDVKLAGATATVAVAPLPLPLPVVAEASIEAALAVGKLAPEQLPEAVSVPQSTSVPSA